MALMSMEPFSPRRKPLRTSTTRETPPPSVSPPTLTRASPPWPPSRSTMFTTPAMASEP
ncbi:MAG: hypothetical protein WDM92_00995 [Caulobacteraceae bacterium]